MNKAGQNVDFYCTIPIVNAVRSQLNRTNTTRNNDLHEMHLITSAVLTQFNQTIRANQGKLYLSTVQQVMGEIKMVKAEGRIE